MLEQIEGEFKSDPDFKTCLRKAWGVVDLTISPIKKGDGHIYFYYSEEAGLQARVNTGAVEEVYLNNFLSVLRTYLGMPPKDFYKVDPLVSVAAAMETTVEEHRDNVFFYTQGTGFGIRITKFYNANGCRTLYEFKQSSPMVVPEKPSAEWFAAVKKLLQCP